MKNAKYKIYTTLVIAK